MKFSPHVEDCPRTPNCFQALCFKFFFLHRLGDVTCPRVGGSLAVPYINCFSFTSVNLLSKDSLSL